MYSVEGPALTEQDIKLRTVEYTYNGANSLEYIAFTVDQSHVTTYMFLGMDTLRSTDSGNMVSWTDMRSMYVCIYLGTYGVRISVCN